MDSQIESSDVLLPKRIFRLATPSLRFIFGFKAAINTTENLVSGFLLLSSERIA